VQYRKSLLLLDKTADEEENSVAGAARRINSGMTCAWKSSERYLEIPWPIWVEK